MNYDDWGEKPVPVLDPESEPYWEAAREGELVVQHCGDCGERQFYPRRLCRNCWSRDLAFEPVAGTGTVHSFTRCHTPGQPGYGEETPYTVALVELDLPDPNPSGRAVRLTTHVDCPDEELAVGLPVTVGFERVSDEPAVHLPVFEPETPD
jgi:uncharacterized OB-fold protein